MSEKHFNVRVRGWNNGEVTGQRWDVSLEPSSPSTVPLGMFSKCDRAGLGSGCLSALPSSSEGVGSFFPVHFLSQLFFPCLINKSCSLPKTPSVPTQIQTFPVTTTLRLAELLPLTINYPPEMKLLFNGFWNRLLL